MTMNTLPNTDISPVIHCHQLGKRFDSAQGEIIALDNINLDIYPGEIFGIIGRSGAGKSSLIRCMNLLERPTSGHLKVNGVNLQILSAHALHQARRHIGMIFQQFNLLSQKTVWENIALPLSIMGLSKSAIAKRVSELLVLVDMSGRDKHYPHQLSGGQKQRVAIARALATEPTILLCDEATSALDPHSTQSILHLLQEINHRLGITIVLITHEIDVIKSICHRVGLLNNGHLLQIKSVADFFSQSLERTDLHHQTLTTYLGADLYDERLLTLCQAKQLNGLLLRIRFYGESAAKPLIAHLVKEVGLDINILQANLEFVGGDLMGTMIIQVGMHFHIDAGLAFLRAQGVIVEELAHVS